MDSTIPHQTLANDLVHQRERLCDAMRYSIQQNTDMVIISKNKQLIPCHSSLLVLFSPFVAHLLSSIPCCASPTIILPDFPALHIRKLIHILGCGQTIPTSKNADIKIIEEIAQILQISITDLSVEPYCGNPLNLLIEMKQEANSFKIKQESISSEKVTVEASSLKQEINIPNIKEEIVSIKEEVMDHSEYIEMGENIPKQEYVGEADQLLDDVNIFHNIEQVVHKEALEINAYDKEDFCAVRNDILDDKGESEGLTNMEQCEYIEQNVTIKNPEQKNMVEAQIDIVPPMEQVMQMETVNGKLKCSGILEPYKVCQFFLRGRCQRQNCEFLHPKDLPERKKEKEWERDKERKRVREQDRERDRDKRSYDRSLEPPKIDASCKYFLGSGCKFGMICRFRHDTEKRRVRERSRERSRERIRVQKNDSDDESILKEGDSSDGENVKKSMIVHIMGLSK